MHGIIYTNVSTLVIENAYAKNALENALINVNSHLLSIMSLNVFLNTNSSIIG